MGLHAIRQIPSFLLLLLLLLLHSDQVEGNGSLRVVQSHRRLADDDLMFSDHVVFSYNAKTLSDCARACVQNTECLAFSFCRLKSTANWASCRGHSNADLNGGVGVPGSRLYRLQAGQGPSDHLLCAREHTHALTHARTHTHARARAHAHTHTHTQARRHARAHARTHAHTHTHTHTRTYTYTRARTHAHTHTHTCLLYTSPSPRDFG